MGRRPGVASKGCRGWGRLGACGEGRRDRSAPTAAVRSAAGGAFPAGFPGPGAECERGEPPPCRSKDVTRRRRDAGSEGCPLLRGPLPAFQSLAVAQLFQLPSMDPREAGGGDGGNLRRGLLREVSRKGLLPPGNGVFTLPRQPPLSRGGVGSGRFGRGRGGPGRGNA